MESTGVYWKPVFHILEGRFTVWLINPRDIKKKVEGRKTDVKDAEWIAHLLQFGLLAPSFVPPPPIRELRDLTRQRATLIGQRATLANRIQKVLEDANVKLASVASDPLGVSGRAMIRAMIAGHDDPGELADLARKRLRAKIPQLRQALHGRVTEHHRFLLRALMDQIDQLEAMIARFDERITAAMVPLGQAGERLRKVPGIGARSAEAILGEIGADMGPFPTAGHLSSWAGMCPGKDESAGVQRSGKTGKGSAWLRSVLVQVAWAAVHSKATIFSALYGRWVKRLGRKKALVAVAHKLLVVIHKLLKDGVDYVERAGVPPTVRPTA
jgi:transposase